MSTAAVTLIHRSEGRVQKQLPKGIRIWYASGLFAVGDATGGNMTLRVAFNPSAAPDFQPYVSLSTITVRCRVAAATKEFEVILNGGEWERARSTSFDSVVTKFGTVETFGAAEFTGAYEGIAYLGRTLARTSGQLTVRRANVDLMTCSIFLSGLISDKPFVPLDVWRV